MSDDVAAIARKLAPIERERMTGWQGCGGAAYNAVSEALCNIGLLNADWSHSELGLALRNHLLDEAKP
jgi:hypothetical protein